MVCDVSKITRRFLTFVLAANYALAVMLATCLHNHGHHGHEAATIEGADCPALHECCHSPFRGGAEKGLSFETRDDCAACEFLAHKPVPPAQLEEVRSGDLVAAVAIVRPVARALGLTHTWLIRGPPAVA
jgi:hypothetical protein